MSQLYNFKDPYIKDAIKIFDDAGNVIPWDFNTFPDTQVQIKILKHDWESSDRSVDAMPTVYASLYSPTVVDLFFQLIDSFVINKVKINYLYGARSDKWEAGDYLVSNTAEYICLRLCEHFSFDALEFLAPHCYDYCNGRGVINFDLPDCVNLDDYDLVIYPDESSRKRFSKVDKVGIVCEKHRDQETGKILSHVIPNLPDYVKRVLILDDIIDRGQSFINYGETIPKNVKADLFAFHGVLTDCAPIRLFKYYENIIVSNSLPHVQSMADIFSAWKNHKINYKLACEQLWVENASEYKDFVPGNLIVFDVWNSQL